MSGNLKTLEPNLEYVRLTLPLLHPRLWRDWVKTLTAMFAPPNLLSNSCRETAPIKQGGTEHPGESVGQYALRISSLFNRLLAESHRTAPSKKSPNIFAWERLKTYDFENGFLPSIRNERVREDSAHSFALARDRARKHASNNFHGTSTTNLYSVVSTPTIPLKNQLETRPDDVQATIASLVDEPKHHKRGRSKTKRRATHVRQDKRSSKGKFTNRVTRPNACNYKHCMRPTTHKTEDCLFAKLAAKTGADA